MRSMTMKADRLPSAFRWGVGGVGYPFTLCERGKQNRSEPAEGGVNGGSSPRVSAS